MTEPQYGIWIPVYGNWVPLNQPEDPFDASYARARSLFAVLSLCAGVRSLCRRGDTKG
ncbi:MAG: hypothetical protein RMY16_02125 [Nostoc sp. DedQUE12b]|uniref:hypothetical protein n=1 Tax=Nostoc sp. DedQUE12b TaxID=3075398 RepID=UPI002AD4F8A9|nr:hypothetical protein [Nostoc sp. DedQUE12b]MDZ8084381.1 hypothetical protein [Nostoc sp. DedQUE12b]